MEKVKKENWEVVTKYGIRGNACPKCTVYPQLLHNKEEGMWTLKCPICQYQEAWGIEDLDETYLEMLTRIYNESILLIEVGAKTMQLYGVKNGDYLVYKEEDASFLKGFTNLIEATDFMKKCKDDGVDTRLYYLWENHLHRMIGSNVLDEDWET